MPLRDIAPLLSQPESERIERTTSLTNTDKFSIDVLCETLSARRPVRVSAMRDEYVERYPAADLREFIMNGLVHRSYAATAPLRVVEFSDRIEIQNPGGLYGGASPANFPWLPAYRNPILAEGCKVLGYVNRIGMGVVYAQSVLRNNGNGEAAYEFSPDHVKVTVGPAPRWQAERGY